jgi:hypothetical protein
MSHGPRCIRSDGDWFCTPDCNHEREAAAADFCDEINSLQRTLAGVRERAEKAEQERDAALAEAASLRERIEILRRNMAHGDAVGRALAVQEVDANWRIILRLAEARAERAERAVNCNAEAREIVEQLRRDNVIDYGTYSRLADLLLEQ